jgi:hypothetical protein
MIKFSIFDDYADGKDEAELAIFNAVCECGHKLHEHGFVVDWNGIQKFWVSQCTSCPVVDGVFTCKEFRLAEKKNEN